MSTVYCSNRNIPLLCQTVCTVPIVALENYCKWYSIYVLMPDASVVQVPSSLIMEYEDLTNETLSMDHNFHPILLEYIATHYKGEVDQRSKEVATGRWVMEIMGGKLNGHPDCDR